MTTKFGVERDSFVHMATRDGEIMMVIAVYPDPHITRYDLQAIDGTTYANIGEYELSKCADEEVQARLVELPRG